MSRWSHIRLVIDKSADIPYMVQGWGSHPEFPNFPLWQNLGGFLESDLSEGWARDAAKHWAEVYRAKLMPEITVKEGEKLDACYLNPQ